MLFYLIAIINIQPYKLKAICYPSTDSQFVLRFLELIQNHSSEALKVVSRAYQVAFEGPIFTKHTISIPIIVMIGRQCNETPSHSKTATIRRGMTLNLL